MLRSSQTFHFRPNHQMVSLPSRTDALIPEFFLCPTSLIGLSSWGCSYQPCSPGWGLPTHWDCPLSYLFFRGAFILECRPNPRYGASSGSRTHTICLEGRSTSRYTIPAFISFLAFLTYILYQKFQEKSNFVGLWREVVESNHREQGHNLPFYH